MVAMTSGTRELVRAILDYERADKATDHELIDAIRSGDIEYWMDAIEASALFAPGELRRMRALFETEPEELVAVLREGTDELTDRRGTVKRRDSWVTGMAARSGCIGSASAM
ncbi:hypothetical protein IEU95_13505 [Hoyosella rhizosphaerae]|uniref:Uncharacterized protein n=1 Tax=Hoyosella rhizosphaerae TaxID=1755582 RepID=A0A916UGT4_9ACTN|nr:hypothetical protein [Hoyosella rhizosphaerae]MBN4927855.1 hypothetical protein [Hoyosella rhizosphaerae]GGC70490.1 hypothetical protein GCM10011410_24180 [Hoyosella rhizosphaerae]